MHLMKKPAQIRNKHPLYLNNLQCSYYPGESWPCGSPGWRGRRRPGRSCTWWSCGRPGGGRGLRQAPVRPHAPAAPSVPCGRRAKAGQVCRANVLKTNKQLYWLPKKEPFLQAKLTDSRNAISRGRFAPKNAKLWIFQRRLLKVYTIQHHHFLIHLSSLIIFLFFQKSGNVTKCCVMYYYVCFRRALIKSY